MGVGLAVQARVLRGIDALAMRWGRGIAPHLATGLAGEREALFHLRAMGFVVVARRWKSARLRGDVDLIAWEGGTLCFVEVKTRTGRDVMEPAESAVNADKQSMLRKMARAYLKGFPAELRRTVTVRFDVVSVYRMMDEIQFEVRRGAFGWE